MLPIVGWDAAGLIAVAVALLAGLGLYTHLVTVVARGQRVPLLGEPPWGRSQTSLYVGLTIFGVFGLSDGWQRLGLAAVVSAYVYAVAYVHNKRLPQHEPDDVDVS